jgi:ABC-type lipoprotein release transport system permease subunit
MTIGRLIFREILYRKLTFALAVLAVAVAVGCLVAVLTLLRLHDARTAEILTERETQTKQSMRKLEDDYRRIMLHLGFNLLIVPRDQDRADLFAGDHPSAFMPEEYVERLARSGVASINHLLPILQEKVFWQEQRRTILLAGTRGEVPILRQNKKKPLLDAVPPGGMAVGYELHRSLGLARGDTVTMTLANGLDTEKTVRGKFTVHKLMPPRGPKEDVTAWINLAEAQKLLRRPGQINAILALECTCTEDRLDRIRSEVAGILPDTQVIELASQALARAEARNRAAQAAREALAQEKANRASTKERQEEFALVLLPLVLLGSVVGMGLLAFSNARERAGEIGILAALGVSRGKVCTLFLGKAVVAGPTGGVLGFAGGLAAGMMLGEAPPSIVECFDPELLVAVLVTAPMIGALASWLPAWQAIRQDPAIVLQQE